jgi:protein involved in temperature-dependent protein secretion
MNADERLRSGHIEEALDARQEQGRSQPGNAALRNQQFDPVGG